MADRHHRRLQSGDCGLLHFLRQPVGGAHRLDARQAIWRKADAHWIVFGIPEIFYTDNGSDFTSVHLEQVAADIKMRLVFSTPGRPRGRGRIERFFETVNQMFLCAARLYRTRRRSRPGRIDDHRPRSWFPGIPARLPHPSSQRNQSPRPRSVGSSADLSHEWRTYWSISICCS